MTTVTLKIDEDKQELVEALMVIIKNFQGVSYEISTDNKEKEVLSNLSKVCKNIKSKKAFKTSMPIEDFYKELEND